MFQCNGIRATAGAVLLSSADPKPPIAMKLLGTYTGFPVTAVALLQLVLLLQLMVVSHLPRVSAGACQGANCDECVANGCGWCSDGAGTCWTGTIIKPDDGLSCGLAAWHVNTCAVPLTIVAIVCACVGFVVLVAIVCCCCCWCRRRRRERLAQSRLLDDYQEMEYYRDRPVEEFAPKTSMRRKELEQKYGLKPRQ